MHGSCLKIKILGFTILDTLLIRERVNCLLEYSFILFNINIRQCAYNSFSWLFWMTLSAVIVFFSFLSALYQHIILLSTTINSLRRKSWKFTAGIEVIYRWANCHLVVIMDMFLYWDGRVYPWKSEYRGTFSKEIIIYCEWNLHSAKTTISLPNYSVEFLRICGHIW